MHGGLAKENDVDPSGTRHSGRGGDRNAVENPKCRREWASRRAIRLPWCRHELRVNVSRPHLADANSRPLLLNRLQDHRMEPALALPFPHQRLAADKRHMHPRAQAAPVDARAKVKTPRCDNERRSRHPARPAPIRALREHHHLRSRHDHQHRQHGPSPPSRASMQPRYPGRRRAALRAHHAGLAPDDPRQVMAALRTVRSRSSPPHHPRRSPHQREPDQNRAKNDPKKIGHEMMIHARARHHGSTQSRDLAM